MYERHQTVAFGLRNWTKNEEETNICRRRVKDALMSAPPLAPIFYNQNSVPNLKTLCFSKEECSKFNVFSIKNSNHLLKIVAVCLSKNIHNCLLKIVDFLF